MSGHFINKCICGNVLSQCRCAGAGVPKVEHILAPCSCEVPWKPPFMDYDHDPQKDGETFEVRAFFREGVLNLCVADDSPGIPDGPLPMNVFVKRIKNRSLDDLGVQHRADEQDPQR